MQITKQIDQLIANLNALKPLLSEDTLSNKERFNDVLKASIENSSNIDSKSSEPASKIKTNSPNWVDDGYDYKISEPRKPNMREMMEALSGKSVEELYSEKMSNWRDHSELASDLLYGVVGDKNDTRDWNAIMASTDIVSEARAETNRMHQPVIDIASEFDLNNNLIKQYPVIKSSSGEVLRSLTGETKQIQDVLENFAIKNDSVPTDLEDRIMIENFDKSIFELLKNLPENQNNSLKTNTNDTLEVLALKSHLSTVGNSQSELVPIEEMEKL
jgi:hypothetical protein